MSLISTNSQLNDFCNQINLDNGLAIDTEFMRQNTFYAIPALIQIAQETPNSVIKTCIDVPKISNWNSLKTVLEQVPYCLAHSPDQDFEIFDQLFGIDWQFKLYDTQIAAALLGHQPQISYANIVHSILDLEIDKSQSRTDWLKRPLTTAQIDYALTDVLHLPSIWKQLKSNLIKKDRLNWFLSDCARNLKLHHSSHHTKNAWKTVKGIKRLKNHNFAIAASLAAWREEKAIQADTPRRWMLADDVILDLAENNKLLKNIKAKWSILRKNEDFVIGLINSPMQEYLNFPTQHFDPLSSHEKTLYKALKTYCNTQAENLEIDPSVIANRKTLEKIVRGNNEFLDLENWRHRILNNYIQQ